MKEVLAVIAATIAIGGNVPYLRDVIIKRITPHPYTWLIWTIVSAITLFGQIAKGAGIGALPTAVAALFTLTIFILSLRHVLTLLSLSTYNIATTLHSLAMIMTNSIMTLMILFKKPRHESKNLKSSSLSARNLTNTNR